jgi:hypothetical protein
MKSVRALRLLSAEMQPVMQLWMPPILSMLGTLIVVVFTAWLNTKALSAQN